MSEKKRDTFRTVVWGCLFGAYGLLFLIAFAVLFSANIWYSSDGVQAKLMANGHPVTSVVSTDWYFFDYSEITVIEAGQEKTYLIDTNMLSLCTFYPVD